MKNLKSQFSDNRSAQRVVVCRVQVNEDFYVYYYNMCLFLRNICVENSINIKIVHHQQ